MFKKKWDEEAYIKKKLEENEELHEKQKFEKIKLDQTKRNSDTTITVDINGGDKDFDNIKIEAERLISERMDEVIMQESVLEEQNYIKDIMRMHAHSQGSAFTELVKHVERLEKRIEALEEHGIGVVDSDSRMERIKDIIRRKRKG